MTVATTQQRQRGFTLIELLFVVALIGIMLAIAVPSFAAFIANYRATSAVNDLLQAVVQARSEALKQGRRIVVAPYTAPPPTGTPNSSGQWSNGWAIFTHKDPTNGNFAVGDQIIFVHQPTSSSTTFLGPNGAPALSIFGSGNYVMFDGNGYPRVPALSGSLGGIQLTDAVGAKTSVRTLCLATLGRPRIVNGTDACS